MAQGPVLTDTLSGADGASLSLSLSVACTRSWCSYAPPLMNSLNQGSSLPPKFKSHFYLAAQIKSPLLFGVCAGQDWPQLISFAAGLRPWFQLIFFRRPGPGLGSNLFLFAVWRPARPVTYFFAGPLTIDFIKEMADRAPN